MSRVTTECLRNPLDDIQSAAVESFGHFSAFHHAVSTPELQRRVVDRLVAATADANPSCARGACQAVCFAPELAQDLR